MLLHILFITTAENPVLQRYTVVEGNIVLPNTGNVNYLKLVVHVMSNR